MSHSRSCSDVHALPKSLRGVLPARARVCRRARVSGRVPVLTFTETTPPLSYITFLCLSTPLPLDYSIHCRERGGGGSQVHPGPGR